MTSKYYDVTVIGGGPAGLTGSLYTSRADLNTLVLDKPNFLLNKVKKIENYFGFPEGISGKEILKRGRKQAEKFGTDIIKEEALIVKFEDNYIVETSENKYFSKGLILAPGIQHEKPSIKNLESFEGQGVSYCVTCDAPFYKDKEVGVLGSKDYAAKEVLELSEFTDKITLFTNGKDIEIKDGLLEELENKNIELNEDKIKKFTGDNSLDGIIVENEEIKLDGLFVAVGTSGSVNFARSLGIPVKGNKIIVNENLSSGLPRLYAAGDCTGEPRQIATAVGEGARAALNLIEELRDKKYKDWQKKT